jgi:gliding motility-associated-like protein
LTQDPILGIELNIASEKCAGGEDGSINLEGIVGGKMPFQYFVNDIETNVISESNLSAGVYDIEIIDANRCTVDTTVVINRGTEISVDLGPDMQVSVGEPVNISVISSGPINDFGWFVDGLSTSSGSLEGISLVADENLLIIMKAFSQEGCVAQDSIYVDVVLTLDDVKIYIPNVFMPSSSSSNAALNVSLHESILSIDKFSIYDRWGNLVHQVLSPVGRFNVNLWDGTYKGKMVDPGVFAYICEVTTVVEGQKKLFTGNVTVLR